MNTEDAVLKSHFDYMRYPFDSTDSTMYKI